MHSYQASSRAPPYRYKRSEKISPLFARWIFIVSARIARIDKLSSRIMHEASNGVVSRWLIRNWPDTDPLFRKIRQNAPRERREERGGKRAVVKDLKASTAYVATTWRSLSERAARCPVDAVSWKRDRSSLSSVESRGKPTVDPCCEGRRPAWQ